MKIYTMADRLTVKIGELTFKLAPLSYKQKTEIRGLYTIGKKEDAAILTMKYSIKDVDGLETISGEKFKLSFDENGLSEESLDNLLNSMEAPKLILACANLMDAIPNVMVVPGTDKPLEGVKIIDPFLEKAQQA